MPSRRYPLAPRERGRGEGVRHEAALSDLATIPQPLTGIKTLPPRRRRGHILLPLLLLLLVAATCQAADITDYAVIRQPVLNPAGKELIAIRGFKCDGKAELLAVDPYTFGTSVLAASEVRPVEHSAVAALADSPFMKALERHTSGPFRLQNAGASRADAAVDGVCLTVDLCPSKRRFEREVFEAAAALGNGAPVPMTVAITGVWLSNHPEEVAFLKQEVAAGRLAITWMNHSSHHVYEPKVPLAENFLLTPGTNFLHEVLDLEQQLLAVGLVPSPFFRFPGLVSDKATITRLRELSLIPIGSDAWLAKGEFPRKGSFILVHGNGNEPKGIKLVLPMLKSKELHLLPLAQAFGGKGNIYHLPRDGYGQNSTTTRSNSPVVPAPASPTHGQAAAQKVTALR